MQKIPGKVIQEGLAIGPVFVIKGNVPKAEKKRIKDVRAELQRLESAKEQAKAQLQNLYEKAAKEMGEAAASVFEAHQALLEDEGYLDSVRDRIRTDLLDAGYAVSAVGNRIAKMLAEKGDEYLAARAADIREISRRLIQNLAGQQAEAFAFGPPSVIVADDLTPGELVHMNREKILAIVTVHGSVYSHTAILARMMNIPALTGVLVNLDELHTGMTAVVDGFQGEVVLEPLEEFCQGIKKKMQQEREESELLQAFKGKADITLDGQKLLVCANIQVVEDVKRALENDAGGIGLFRSEFLYLGRTDFPTEEEQFRAYRQVAQAMEGKPAVIRTLDIGADKQADFFHLEKENNPALGYRAIRICLRQPEIFEVQLRALLRASVFGNLSILYPMITSVKEVFRIREIVEKTARELEQAQVAYQIPRQGIMIETPAAVMISDELARLVDFFSIGTNDLTQYTLAMDRQNEKLADFYDPRHKAILRMIQMTADNAHKAGIRVGICGELGADIELTEEFVRMGVDELSVSPSRILRVRKRIREIGGKCG